MVVAVRAATALVTSLNTFLFSYWLGTALVWSGSLLMYAAKLGALLYALAAGWAVWRLTAQPGDGLLRAAVLGALLTGSVCFALGFFGPLLLAPEATRGPLLALFVTGPGGFVLGGACGCAICLWRRRRRVGGSGSSPAEA